MKKRIYISMLILTFVSVIFTSVLLLISFDVSSVNQVKSELRNNAIFIERSLNYEENQISYMKKLDLSETNLRVTLIDDKGEVLYDNTEEASVLENHADREEVIEALEKGVGESQRVSETIKETTFYYAIQLKNGNVVRVGKTTDSIYGVFFSILRQSILIVVLVLIFCIITARIMTKGIVEPINKIDFKKHANTYDEISPFVRKIIDQNEQISKVRKKVDKQSNIIETITHSLNEGLILVDKKGKVISMNEVVQEILQTNGDFVGRNIREVTDNEIVLEQVKLTLEGKNNNVITEIENHIYQVFCTGVNKGALLLFWDVTEKVMAENIRREFTANVSHELKTPLTTISGFAELLSKGMVKEEDIADVSQKMKKESDRLIVLIGEIIRLAELDEAKGDKVYESVDLGSVALEVKESLLPKAELNHVNININVDNVQLNANKQMMFELLYNLVENGIKYNKPNGQVNISVEKITGVTEIKVSDTGIGIDKVHHDRIFERFYRVDKSRSKKKGGTGLGLSIVKHIVNYHDGVVLIDSEEDKGTVVTVKIPELETN